MFSGKAVGLRQMSHAYQVFSGNLNSDSHACGSNIYQTEQFLQSSIGLFLVTYVVLSCNILEKRVSTQLLKMTKNNILKHLVSVLKRHSS